MIFFGWLEKCSCVVIRVESVWAFEDKLNGDIAHSRSSASVPFDRKHGIQFLPSVLSVVVDDPLVANMMDEQEICPCPCLSFYLHLSRSLLHKKGRLLHFLVPVVHSLRDRGRQGSAASENRDVIQNNI